MLFAEWNPGDLGVQELRAKKFESTATKISWYASLLGLWIFAWSLHAFVDAIVISSAVDVESTMVMPIAVCSVLDLTARQHGVEAPCVVTCCMYATRVL